MSQPEVVVSAAHVRKSFGDKEVLRDLVRRADVGQPLQFVNMKS